MKKKTPAAVKGMDKIGVESLLRHLRAKCEVDCELYYINVDANDAPNKIISRLWDVVTYRPDLARRVEELCRDREVGRPKFADLLRNAIKVANWPLDFR